MPGTVPLAGQLVQAVNDLRTAQTDLEERSRTYADAERKYRHAKAVAYLRSHGANITERESNAELMTIAATHEGEALTLNDIRHQRDLADGLRTSALEAVRSYRGVVSALQSLASLEKSEAELARYGPQEAWGATP